MPNLTPGYQIARNLGYGRGSKNKQEDYKETLYKMTDNYFKADDPAEKRLAIDMMTVFLGSMPSEVQEKLRPTIEAGPFGAENMKRERWMIENPRPQITAGLKDSPYLHAEQVFAQKDWESKLKNIGSGTPMDAQGLIGLDENMFARRYKDGSISIMNKEEIEKTGKLGIPFNEFMPSGVAKIKDSTRKFTNQWGASQTEQEYIDLEGNRTWKPTEINRQTQETEEDKGLRRFHIDFLNENNDNPLVKLVYDAMEKEKPINEIIDKIISPSFPNYHFLSKGKYTDGWGSFDIKDLKLNFVKGVEVQAVKGDRLHRFVWSYTPNGKVALYHKKTGAMLDTNEAIEAAVKENNIPVPDDFVGRF